MLYTVKEQMSLLWLLWIGNNNEYHYTLSLRFYKNRNSIQSL